MSFTFGRPKDTLRELVRSQHDESLRYLRQHDEHFAEDRRRWDKEERRRDEEFARYREKSLAREERLDRLVEETREFNREILLRNEKVYKEVLIRLEKLGEETRASTTQIESNTEETRAQTQALLRLIDRMDGRDDAAAA